MNRRDFIAGSASAAIWTTGVAAQQRRARRVGLLVSTSESVHAPLVEALRAGLRGLGYVEPTNIIVEARYAPGSYERLRALADELVRMDVDLIVAHGTPGTSAAKQATSTIPVVMAVSGDAVASGLVASLARPGGNITGTTFLSPELSAKRLEILSEALPNTHRVAVLVNPSNASNVPVMRALNPAAASLNLELNMVDARTPAEFNAAFSSMAKSGVDALLVSEDSIFVKNAATLATNAASAHLPSIGFPEFARSGGLVGYGVNFRDVWRHAAYFVDRVLKGAKPGEIPVEQPTRFHLVINLDGQRTEMLQGQATIVFVPEAGMAPSRQFRDHPERSEAAPPRVARRAQVICNQSLKGA
jgi:putative tryptophan/tyrosine transport system substrate-binding protein